MNSHDEVYALIRDGQQVKNAYLTALYADSPDQQIDYETRLREQQERVDILEAVLATERLVLATLKITCPAPKQGASNGGSCAG